MSLSNALADEAEAIKVIVADSEAAAAQSIDKAIEAGQRLLAAKADASHGTWLPFLERAGIPERKAQRLMALARSGMKSDRVTDLGGVTAALRFISRRKLPSAGNFLDIEAKSSTRRAATGTVWESLEHPGFYYCAVMTNPEQEGENAPVVWTRRPVSGEATVFDDGLPVFEPVWEFFERHMGFAPSQWEFIEDGCLGEVLAPFLGLPHPLQGADAAAHGEMLSSMGFSLSQPAPLNP